MANSNPASMLNGTRDYPIPGAGAVDVTVSTAGGTSATVAVDKFTYH